MSFLTWLARRRRGDPDCVRHAGGLMACFRLYLGEVFEGRR